jgi:hypothetical protein
LFPYLIVLHTHDGPSEHALVDILKMQSEGRDKSIRDRITHERIGYVIEDGTLGIELNISTLHSFHLLNRSDVLRKDAHSARLTVRKNLASLCRHLQQYSGSAGRPDALVYESEEARMWLTEPPLCV